MGPPRNSLHTGDVPFRIVYCSSSSADQPVTELLNHSPSGPGWISESRPEFPVELVLSFERPVFLTGVQFLSHESFVAQRIDLFCCSESVLLQHYADSIAADTVTATHPGSVAHRPAPSDIGLLTPQEVDDLRWTRLGYVNLARPSLNALSRELKTVSVTRQHVTGLRCLLSTPHPVLFNRHSLVSLIMLKVLGSQTPSPPRTPAESARSDGNGRDAAASAFRRAIRVSDSPTTGAPGVRAMVAATAARVPGAPPSPTKPTATATTLSHPIAARTNSTNAADPTVQSYLAELLTSKAEAIQKEDYRRAKAIKDLETVLESLALRVGTLEIAKQRAVETEDFDGAVALSESIKSLRSAALDARDMARSTVSKRIVPSPSSSSPPAVDFLQAPPAPPPPSVPEASVSVATNTEPISTENDLASAATPNPTGPRSHVSFVDGADVRGARGREVDAPLLSPAPTPAATGSHSPTSAHSAGSHSSSADWDKYCLVPAGLVLTSLEASILSAVSEAVPSAVEGGKQTFCGIKSPVNVEQMGLAEIASTVDAVASSLPVTLLDCMLGGAPLTSSTTFMEPTVTPGDASHSGTSPLSSVPSVAVKLAASLELLPGSAIFIACKGDGDVTSLNQRTVAHRITAAMATAVGRAVVRLLLADQWRIRQAALRAICNRWSEHGGAGWGLPSWCFIRAVLTFISASSWGSLSDPSPYVFFGAIRLVKSFFTSPTIMFSTSMYPAGITLRVVEEVERTYSHPTDTIASTVSAILPQEREVPIFAAIYSILCLSHPMCPLPVVRALLLRLADADRRVSEGARLALELVISADIPATSIQTVLSALVNDSGRSYITERLPHVPHGSAIPMLAIRWLLHEAAASNDRARSTVKSSALKQSSKSQSATAGRSDAWKGVVSSALRVLVSVLEDGGLEVLAAAPVDTLFEHLAPLLFSADPVLRVAAMASTSSLAAALCRAIEPSHRRGMSLRLWLPPDPQATLAAIKTTVATAEEVAGTATMRSR